MSIWSFLFGTNSIPSTTPSVNPSTGLPMIDNTPIDVGGNTYGTSNDWHSDTSWGSSDSFSSSGFDY